MECPHEISVILLGILKIGILRIRGSTDPRRCFLEADHIHNLPDLLENYSRDRLAYYWEVERPSFISALPEGERENYETLWRRLRPLAEASCVSAVPR